MILMQGKCNVAKVMIDEIDDATRDQIQGFLNHPAFGMGRIAIMPDCHAGAGSCIGFTMQLGNHIMPQIVGVDIGCGMLAVNFGKHECDPVKLDEFIKANIPSGHNINDAPFDTTRVAVRKVWDGFLEDFPVACELAGIERRKALRAIGSLGGGNHFIEAARDEKDNLWIVVHSGSRNFGKRIADFYQEKAREACKEFFLDPEKDMEFLPQSHEYAGEYLRSMKVAQQYASINRHEMMSRITEWLNTTPMQFVESVHNYIDFEDKIIRKGAIRAHEGKLCIIPFNSAEGSVICRGKGNKDWNYSAPHGAGRLMSRSKAFETLDYKEYQAKLAEKGVYSSTANSSTLDEAPMAYKPSDSILAAIEPTVEIVARLKPFYNFKASEGGRRRIPKGDA